MGIIYYDQITLERIQKMHPVLRDSLKQEYIAMNMALPKDIRLRFTATYRSFAEQDALYEQGRTKPGKKVTNAKGGQSYHNYGLAFDIVLLTKDSKGDFTQCIWTVNNYWKKCAEYFKSKGWEWGGDFKSFKDYPHFQKTFGYPIKELVKMNSLIDSGRAYPNFKVVKH